VDPAFPPNPAEAARRIFFFFFPFLHDLPYLPSFFPPSIAEIVPILEGSSVGRFFFLDRIGCLDIAVQVVNCLNPLE